MIQLDTFAFPLLKLNMMNNNLAPECLPQFILNSHSTYHF